MDFSNLIKNVSEENQFNVVPAGKYDVTVESVDLRQSSSGGKYFNLKMKINNGEFKGRYLFDLINILVPGSDQATNIGLARLKRISNLLNVSDTSLIIGKSLIVDVVIKSDPKYGDKNVIKYYVDSLYSDTTPTYTTAKKVITSDDIPF